MATGQHIHVPDVLQIPLTGRCGDRRVLRGWATVLNDDFGRELAEIPWSMNNKGYAVRKRHVNETGPERVFLHRVIFEHYHGPMPAGLETDHIDRTPLNNTPDNLRAVTNTQNQANKGKQKNNTSGFRGVHWYKQCKRWGAAIRVNRHRIYLGAFLTAKEAAIAVNQAYAIHHPHVPPPNQID